MYHEGVSLILSGHLLLVYSISINGRDSAQSGRAAYVLHAHLCFLILVVTHQDHIVANAFENLDRNLSLCCLLSSNMQMGTSYIKHFALTEGQGLTLPNT